MLENRATFLEKERINGTVRCLRPVRLINFGAVKSFSERLLQATVDFDSILCVGLDIDADRIDPESPPSLDEMKSFTKSVIEATLDHVCAFKLNLAFFESYGSKGFAWLEETLDFIGGRRLTIAHGH